jgi:hypothetical protein
MACPVGLILYKFIYNTNAQPINFVANSAIFTTSYCMFLEAQIVSKTNKCCYQSSDPTHLNFKSLSVLSIPTMLVCVFPPLSDVGRL